MSKNLFFGLLNLAMWAFISSVFIFHGAIEVGVFTAIFGVVDAVIVMCGDMDFSFPTIIVFVAVIIGLVVVNKGEENYNHAVELYENGQYEEAMDEFIRINDDEYIEKYTVYKLKGTDLVREAK